VEQDPQVKHVFRCHVLMLQQHPILSQTSTIHGYQCSMPNNITLLWAKDLNLKYDWVSNVTSM
jgi:hypothetical protein